MWRLRLTRGGSASAHTVRLPGDGARDSAAAHTVCLPGDVMMHQQGRQSALPDRHIGDRRIGTPPPATIAAFDFDGTLTTRDSLLRFISWRRRRAEVVLDLVKTLPLLALYGARLVGNETHKMALFAGAFRGMPADAFERWARDFARAELPLMIRDEALERVSFHQQRGDRVVIVSASPTDWIVPWAASEGITEIIGNRAEVSDGRVTGRLAGANCYGSEKLRRLLALNPERESYTLFAYGDGRGDRELLAAADHAYYRCFE